MKKIISIIAIVAMLCMTISLSAFAATDAKILVTADKTSVEVGDTITFTVKVTADTTANKGIAGTSKVIPTWDTSKFEFIGAEAGENTLEYSKDPTVSTAYVADGKLTFSQGYSASADKSLVKAQEFVFGTFQLKALEAGEFSISSNSSTSVVLNISGGNKNSKETLTTFDAVTITVAAAGGSEEIFDVKEETVAGTKVAFFAKNVTGEALAAGTYGIIFGNKTYPAGVGYDPETGAEVSYACPKDGSWVVGFADSKGKLSGDYKYQAYYKLNGETKTTAEKDINIQ